MKELGQMMFGNPTGDYEMGDFENCLIDYLCAEIDRVYWNKNQQEWNRHDDPQIDGITFNPYSWSDDKIEQSKPNLLFSHSPQEIRWYKHIGRGQSSTIKWDEKEWRKWFDGALKIIRLYDPSIDDYLLKK